MRLFGIVLLLIFIYGCNKEKLKAREAYFVQTDKAVVATTYSLEGTSNHKITDIWYYVEGDFKGAFPVGSLLPIPATGPAQVQFIAGIKNNGISATRKPYEFYQAYVLDTSVAPGVTVNRNFVFQYKPGLRFHMIEDFETVGGFSTIELKKSNDTDTGFAVISDPNHVYEGQKSIYMTMSDDRPFLRLLSTNTFSLPASGATVYLELNYKCSQPFEVGIYSDFTYKPAVTVNTSEDWNKIYVQLTAAVSSNPVTTKQGFYLKAIKSSDNPFIYIDNIKIISY
jgi:hypothetical protein